MFRLALLVLAVGALIGVEHKKRPRITRPGMGKNNVSMLGFEIVDYEARLVRRLGPRTVYGAHSTDDEELLGRQEPLDRADGGVFRLSGYESPVNPVVLASVFYERVLRDLRTPLGAPVVVSARDYCGQDEMKSISRVFCNLRLSPTVVPESSCAAAHLASRQRVGTSERVYIVNLRGTAATGTLYEISVENDEKNQGSVVRRVTMLETARLDGCVSDSEIEKEVVVAVRDCLSERVPHPLSLLPFDRPGAWCTDAEEFVYNLATSLDIIPLVKFSRLEQVYVDRSTGEEHFETALTVDLGALRRSIFAKLSSGGLEGLPEETRCFYITDYLCRSKAMHAVPGLQLMDRDAIIDGTGVINTPEYLLVDSRVVSDSTDTDPMYLGLVDELETKRDAQLIASNLEDHLSRLTYLEDADLDEIRDLVRAGEGGKEPLVGGRTLEDAKRIVSSLNALVSRNRKLSIDDALYREERLALERKIRMVEAESDPRVRENTAEHLDAAKGWLAENEDNRQHAAFSSERMRLTTAHIKASMAVREMDKKVKDELERIAETVKQETEGQDSKPSGDDPTGTPGPDAESVETDWQAPVEDRKDLSGHRDGVEDGKAKEEPSKQEL